MMSARISRPCSLQRVALAGGCRSFGRHRLYLLQPLSGSYLRDGRSASVGPSRPAAHRRQAAARRGRVGGVGEPVPRSQLAGGHDHLPPQAGRSARCRLAGCGHGPGLELAGPTSVVFGFAGLESLRVGRQLALQQACVPLPPRPSADRCLCDLLTLFADRSALTCAWLGCERVSLSSASISLVDRLPRGGAKEWVRRDKFGC